MNAVQHNLEGITIPAGRDLRLETINNLTAILEHDPYLDPWQRADIEKVISHLDSAIREELGMMVRDLQREAGTYQTAILDPVIPVRGDQ